MDAHLWRPNNHHIFEDKRISIEMQMTYQGLHITATQTRISLVFQRQESRSPNSACIGLGKNIFILKKRHIAIELQPS